jgi:hypothetical protein
MVILSSCVPIHAGPLGVTAKWLVFFNFFVCLIVPLARSLSIAAVASGCHKRPFWPNAVLSDQAH